MAAPSVTPAPGFSIIRDVGGVPGFHLATELFTEDVERAFFSVAGQYAPGAAERTGDFHTNDPRDWPACFWAAQNAVRDSGLFPTLLDSDYALAWSYPPGATFGEHFDSRYTWSEHVLGFSFGAPCVITFIFNDTGSRFAPKGARRVKIYLPRHIMSGESRFQWTHKISCIGKTANGAANATAPTWNPRGWRRSWIFRATKLFGLSGRELKRAPPSARAALELRISLQEVHLTMSKAHVAAGKLAAEYLLEVMDELPIRMQRLGPHDAPLWLPGAAARALYTESRPAAAWASVRSYNGGGAGGYGGGADDDAHASARAGAASEARKRARGAGGVASTAGGDDGFDEAEMRAAIARSLNERDAVDIIDLT